MPDRYSEHPWPTKLFVLFHYAAALLVGLTAAGVGIACLPWAGFHLWLGWGISSFRPVPFWTALVLLALFLLRLLFWIPTLESVLALSVCVSASVLLWVLLRHLYGRRIEFSSAQRPGLNRRVELAIRRTRF